MKKTIVMVVALVLSLFLLTACTNKTESDSTTKETTVETTEEATEEATEETTEETAEEATVTSAPEPEREKITIAYHPHITGVGGILNAIDNGYFEEENLEVELVQFTSGATELAAMASGEIDFGYIGVGAHVFAPQGQCVILALDSTDLSGEIMVRADSGIKSMADLKGKNIAISAGTTSELVLSMALKLNGMEKTDVTTVNMDAAGKVTAFMTGKIDAISIEAPYTDQIRKDMGEDAVLTISSSKDFLPEAVFTNSWVTTKDYLEKHEGVAVRFMKAWLRGTEDRYNNMDATVQKVADYIGTDYDTASLVVEKTNWLSTSDMKSLADEGTTLIWYDKLKGMFLDAGLLDAQYDIGPDNYVNLEYLNEAMEQLGIQ